MDYYSAACDREQAQREAQGEIAVELKDYEQRLKDTEAFGKGKICQHCHRMAHDCFDEF
jgi:hypothetical protein